MSPPQPGGWPAEGLVLGTAGNVSERCDELVAITPTGGRLEGLEAEQVSVIDLQGAQWTGSSRPTSELGLHLGDVRALRGRCASSTPTPRMATALSCVLDEVPVVHYGMLALGGSVRVAPYATFGTTELAETTLQALEGRSAALMANHGAVTFSTSAAGRGGGRPAARVGVQRVLARSRGGPPRALGHRAAAGRDRRRDSSAAMGRCVSAMTSPWRDRLGVHVVDVLVRPVERIPAGQGGALVEQIRITPAGSAGGTAITLAKLGARVSERGCHRRR